MYNGPNAAAADPAGAAQDAGANGAGNATFAGAPVQLPIVDGRRALVIGLGSTGTMACNQIIERLTWMYDTPENVPWVRFICLETAPVPTEKPVHRSADFQYLTIKPQEYRNLINNPELFKDNMDFTSWNISSLTGSMDALTDGAKGIRVLGRLALMFPENFSKVQTAIRNALDFLGELDEQEAAARFSRTYREPVQVTLTKETFVYVVGTFCGGTASGSFIDLGYMLRRLPGRNITTTGIFTLPSAQEPDAIKIENAMNAAIELNHYSTDRVRYRSQFPDAPGSPYEANPPQRPYSYAYLVQAKGASRAEYATLTTAIADYLYADLIGSSAAARDGRRADIAEMFIRKDSFGATQKFLTFGLANIEFPYIKVLKGCSVKLAGKGFEAMLGAENMSEVEVKTELARVPLADRRALTERLLQKDNESLRRRVSDHITAAQERALTDDAAMDELQRKLDVGFSDSGVGYPNFGPRTVAVAIDDNERAVRIELEKSVNDLVQSYLAPPAGADANPRGVRPLVAVLKGIEKALEGKKATGSAYLAERSEEMAKAFANTRQCRGDMPLKLTLGTASAVRRYVSLFTAAAQEYYAERLRQATIPTGDRIRANLRTYVHALQERLSNPTVGMETEILRYIADMEALMRRTDVSGAISDGWGRSINGTELFEPGQTIPSEYKRCLEETGGSGAFEAIERRAGIAAVRHYFENAVPHLTLGENRTTGRFHPVEGRNLPPLDDDSLLQLAYNARNAFRALKGKTVAERLMETADAAVILRGALTKSELFLNWEGGHPRNVKGKGDERKSYRFAFFDSRSKASEQLRQQFRQNGIFPGMTESAIADPHQILLLREQGAFSLGTVSEFQEEASDSWWRDYKAQGESGSRHARGDVDEWVTWSRNDEMELAKSRKYLLIAFALGIMEFEDAQRYLLRYDRRSAADPGYLRVTNDLEDAARIIRREGKDGVLIQKIKEQRTLGGDGEMLKRIQAFIEGCENQFRVGTRPVSKTQINDFVEEFILEDADLKKIYFDKPFFENVVNRDYRKTDDEGREAYFCPNKECGKRLGYTPDSLYANITENGRTVQKRQCPYCGKPVP